MTDDERAMYSALTLIRNTEVVLRWTASQLFIVLHSAGFSFALTQRKLGQGFVVSISVVGMVLGIIFVFSLLERAGWLEFWESRLALLDTKSNTNDPHVRIFGSRALEKRNERGITQQRILLIMAYLFIVAWIGMLISAFCVSET